MPVISSQLQLEVNNPPTETYFGTRFSSAFPQEDTSDTHIYGSTSLSSNLSEFGWNQDDIPIRLRIGNGGAGQSGLIKALADAFIDSKTPASANRPAFGISWKLTDTTKTISMLETGEIDVGITYSAPLEAAAIRHGVVREPVRSPVFLDHFLLVGPRENPAGLREEWDVGRMMDEIARSGEEGESEKKLEGFRVRWLSRFDGSATSLREMGIWVGIGRVPWTDLPSSSSRHWYHIYPSYPSAALSTAIKLHEYTLTDRGTYLSLPTELQSECRVYKSPAKTCDLRDPLLFSASLLIGMKARDGKLAREFAEWVVCRAGGQRVIVSFTGKSGGKEVLYCPVPEPHS